MSILVSNCQQICQSPTNLSKSKMLFSFSKSSRFKTTVTNQCDRFYEIGTKNSQRATSLGYGKKYDFTKDLPKTPASGTYEKETLFQYSKRKNKGVGFGSGRGQMESTGFLKKNENPGPGAYEPEQKQMRISYSIKGKSQIQDKQQIKVPGPGTYESLATFTKTGINFASKYRTKTGSSFSKDQKLKYRNYRVPGPGTYNFSQVNLSPEGKYSLSRLQSAKSTKFGNAKRMGIISGRPQTPGPGNYRMPSEFGHYIDQNALKDTTNL